MSVDFLTTQELATRWRLDPKTLSNWRVKRIGPPWTKLGGGRNGKVVYAIAEILVFEKGAVVGDKVSA